MRILLLAIVLACPFASASEDWGAMQYLIGTWTAEGTGAPGQATGSFSFEPDVQGRVLVRKSRAAYPATKDRPAVTHDDLMVVYRELDEHAEGALRAIYFDSEQHVIRYDVSMFGDRIVFTSEPGSSRTQYRFTYERERPDALHMKFEVAVPGKAFTTYVEGTAKRMR